jgi:NAD(P)-dependent dehydrogenase (short-subunit alcohol dehydrogenase family)
MNEQPRKTILLLDADHALGAALVQSLREAGHRVLTHARQAHPDHPVDWVAAQPAAELAQAQLRFGDFDRVVFGLRSGAERIDSPDDVAALHADLACTLGELKTVSQLLTRRDESQIWVLLQEDSMQYYLPVASQPVRSRALMAAVKSLAKELFRFGVRLNALQVQPLAEQLEAPVWKAARDGLKAYALKFKPQTAGDVASMLRALIELPCIPLAGMVMPVGVGYPEANV